MNQNERRLYLIGYLLSEAPGYSDIEIPEDEETQKKLLRALFNVRMPRDTTNEFIRIQDEYLKEAISEKGITDINDLVPIKEDLYLWKGDITTLRCDAIVNAANNRMLGCFVPNHHCIDNAIHTYAGIQLREECYRMMQKQGRYEETGKAKITSAYNLPSKYVIHTVGPIVEGSVTRRDRELLRSCYLSCLKQADEHNIESIAFCCISTGEFSFPNDLAASVAVNAVEDYKKETNSKIKVIFNVFKETDYRIYKTILS